MRYTIKRLQEAGRYTHLARLRVGFDLHFHFVTGAGLGEQAVLCADMKTPPIGAIVLR